MAKTHRFAVTLNMGGRQYAPGSEVPIGGKNGLPEDQVEAIEAVHGKWDKSPAGARALRKEAVAARERELAAARNEIAGLEEKLKAANGAIAARDKRIAELEAEINQLTDPANQGQNPNS